MACSKHELGYEMNRFQIVVSQRFHCPICFLVLKDPVMCKNEHYYCSCCIKKYLENSSFCPTCREPLTVDTLKPASRIVKDYISELNIHCDFHPRGCPEMVQVGHLKRHVESCGFSPVQCSNDGCNVLLNARDKLHHEAEVCDFRKLKCHDCGQLKNEVKEMKDEVKEMKNEVKNEMQEMKNEVKNEMQEMKNEVKNEVKGMKGYLKEMEEEVKGVKTLIDQVLVCQDQMQSRIVNEIKQEVKDQIKNEVRDMKVEINNEVKVMIENEMKEMKVEVKCEIHEEVNKVKELVKEAIKNEMIGIKVEVKRDMTGEMNKMKEEMKNEMKEIVTNAVRDAMTGVKDVEAKRDNSKHVFAFNSDWSSFFLKNTSTTQNSPAKCSSDASDKIFVVGGQTLGMNASTQCFNWTDQTWTLLDSAVEGRSYSCSFLYQGQVVIAGGKKRTKMTNTMKCLNVADPSATWEDFAVNLPFRCTSHKVVNDNDKLLISGGWVQDAEAPSPRYSDAVYEMQLVPPYSSKMLTRLPQTRSDHAMEMFDQKLFIFGGHIDRKITASVVQYDLIKNECKEMPPLPYAVGKMASVLWRDNVLVIGGCDQHDNALRKVVTYDVITGCSQMLPCMKEKRYGCTAVVIGSVVMVMGGRNEEDECLKSVASFDLERQVWQDLPDMLEPRAFATAVVKPNS